MPFYLAISAILYVLEGALGFLETKKSGYSERD
jgi:hypothetical protein